LSFDLSDEALAKSEALAKGDARPKGVATIERRFCVIAFNQGDRIEQLHTLQHKII
jgi:hypothetical protein